MLAQKTIQQFSVSSNWFNRTAKLSVSGVQPKIKFAHLTYMGITGGWDPTMVITVEYESKPALDPRLPWNTEVPIHVWQKVDKFIPARQQGYRLVTSCVARDDSLVELWVQDVVCDKCEGGGILFETITTQALGSAMPNIFTNNFPCPECDGSGRLY